MKYKQLTEVLKKVRFNPNKSGPMKIVAEVDNTEYWQMRAVELIRESLSIREEADNSDYRGKDERFRHIQINNPQRSERLIKAIQLLLLAAAKIDEETLPGTRTKPAPEKKSGRTKKAKRRSRRKT
jgi:hypothetical protein